MSRVKRLRNMNNLIMIIEVIITKNQCSLSVEDLNVLNDAIIRLHVLKGKKGLTDKHLKKDVEIIVNLINTFLIKKYLT